jgi:glycosyltransferase involved in cell wall biosynthesis
MENTTKEKDIRLSVVIVVHNEAESLQQNLPLFLSQSGNTVYEVIVVDDSSTDTTPDLLKSMKAEYTHLHTTFFPQSVPNPSRLQLAMSVGVKAAHGEWIVLADINRPPTSEEWINNLIQTIDNERNAEAVLVYSDKKRQETVCYQSFQQLEEVIPFIRKAERRSGLGHKGIRLKLKRGLYDAIAVRQSRIYEAIRQYDRNIKGFKLTMLRMSVGWSNLWN